MLGIHRDNSDLVCDISISTVRYSKWYSKERLCRPFQLNKTKELVVVWTGSNYKVLIFSSETENVCFLVDNLENRIHGLPFT